MKTPKQIAEENGLTKQTIIKFIKDGLIKAEKVGRVWIVTATDKEIEEALDKRPKQGHAGKYNLPHNK